MKPIPLLAYPIKNSSAPNGVVMDLFGGSGSTLMACEETDRICRTMELDPRYASVIVERFYQYFVEYKNSSANVDDEIYVIRQGKRINYSEIAVQI
jgi:DNA modification methylase